MTFNSNPKKIGGEWKIIQTHTSSRNLPKKN